MAGTPDRVESAGSRNCWGAARERDRLKARFLIRERVANSAEEKSMSRPELSPSDRAALQKIMVYVQKGDRSKFSVSFMATHADLFSDALPIPDEEDEIWAHSFVLCSTWFGPEYSERLREYTQSLETFTILEYASWMRKYCVVGGILLGGGSPVQRGLSKRDIEVAKSSPSFWEYQRCMKACSSRVQKRFFNIFPLDLSCYVVSQVASMRRYADEFRSRRSQSNGKKEDHSSDRIQRPTCEICTNRTNRTRDCGSFMYPSFQLRFPSCNHVFCEPCYWESFLCTIDTCKGDEDVVRCPFCNISAVSATSASPVEYGMVFDSLSKQCTPSIFKTSSKPAERRMISFERFQALPLDGKALKEISRKKKSKKSRTQFLATSWSSAVIPSLGLSQDVRRDKFFCNVERQAFYYVQGCLDAGVDVNWTNEYGQTALHIAAWRGNTRLVKLLMEYGAQTDRSANGGSTPFAAAEANNHQDVMEILRENHGIGVSNDGRTRALLDQYAADGVLPEQPHVTVLIDISEEHPGAGAFLVDSCISHDQIVDLLSLWRSLPTETMNAKKKVGPCSVRSYFCDTEQQVQKILQSALQNAGYASTNSVATVFPHMRFLSYDQEGISLAPHVDLTRVDSVSKERSTHSFLLYLTDCDEGGETCLLRDRSTKEEREVLACVSPKRGRLLVFPHACPHEGRTTQQVPKVLLRGELKFSSSRT